MREKIYGYELILDLQECDPDIIRSKKALEEYVDTLCKIIKMKKYGRTIISHFGDKKPYTKGYSLVQLIETSSITGHFSELWNSAHLNIFSCKKYDEEKASRFSREFFKARRATKRFILRKINPHPTS